ncbi:outer membrane beta-barrel family protein, partial [Klebsiella pneumoniae]|nr:outer membrane beta-barrel family protein [Klebsiella pneumoniae]
GISASAIKGLIGSLDKAAFYDEEASRINDFDMSEDINAAYLMNTLDIGDLRLIAGLRYEGTEFSAKGTGLRDGVYESISSNNRYD